MHQLVGVSMATKLQKFPTVLAILASVLSVCVRLHNPVASWLCPSIPGCLSVPRGGWSADRCVLKAASRAAVINWWTAATLSGRRDCCLYSTEPYLKKVVSFFFFLLITIFLIGFNKHFLIPDFKTEGCQVEINLFILFYSLFLY